MSNHNSTKSIETLPSQEDLVIRQRKDTCALCKHLVDFLGDFPLPHTTEGVPINIKEFVLHEEQCATGHKFTYKELAAMRKGLDEHSSNPLSCEAFKQKFM